jgi:cytochrome c
LPPITSITQESADAHPHQDPRCGLLEHAGVRRGAFRAAHFAHCFPCHSNKPGENKFGPSLAGVFGRKSGTEAGYNYSSAMKGLNVTWDEKTLDEYLQGPGKFVRGTKMVYFVPDEKDRQDVIAYLKTLSK